MALDIAKGIGRTFAFLFGHIVDVLKIAWLPTVLQLAAFYLLMPGYVRGTAALALAPTEPEEIATAWAQAMPGYGLLCVLMLVTFVTFVPMVAGLTRLALKGERPRLPFYIGWGKDEWRITGGWLIFALIVAGLVVLLQGGGFLLGGMMGGGPIAAMIILVVSLVLVMAIFTVCVRLSLFAPATLALGKMGLRESWERTDDHFWGFLGYWLLLFLMLFAVYLIIYFMFVLPPGYFGVFAGVTSQEDVREAMVKANDLMIASYDFSNIGNVLRQLPGAIFGPLAVIITSIAGATAWKLTSESETAE
jgi:hypothetical protein